MIVYTVMSVSFNQTSMELKQIYLHQTTQTQRAFNQTSMELKRLVSGTCSRNSGLLIRPAWNWNLINAIDCKFDEFF